MSVLSERQMIIFSRLSEVSPEVVAAHMSDPRVAEHMPLLTSGWDQDRAVSFIAAKEACWRHDGLGHWAIFCDSRYAGWGGFQKEGDEWDFGLVLKPEYFGLGGSVLRKALAFARTDHRLPFVTFLLSPSRRNLGALARLGAVFVGETRQEGARFLKYRLETGGPG